MTLVAWGLITLFSEPVGSSYIVEIRLHHFWVPRYACNSVTPSEVDHLEKNVIEGKIILRHTCETDRWIGRGWGICPVQKYQRHLPLAETVRKGYFVDAPFGQPAGYPAAVGSVHDLYALGFLQHRVRHCNASQRTSHCQLFIILPVNTQYWKQQGT